MPIRRINGFTLIELSITLVIIGLLAAEINMTFFPTVIAMIVLSAYRV